MTIAYLINQYPKVSHTFIRREIQAIERQGTPILRIAIRGWDAPLVDPEDVTERNQTRYVLKRGPLALFFALIRVTLSHPIRMLRALRLEIKMARRSERLLLVHLIYLAEACQILLWVRSRNITHLHAHFGTNSAEVAMLVHMLGGPAWSFTVHGPEEFDKPFQIGLPEKIRRASFVVAVSSYGRSQLYRFAPYAHWRKIHVVHCGLDQNFLADIISEPSPTRRLVCIGRICPQKGQLLLLEAATLLTEKGVDLELVFAGDGELRETAEEYISRHGLTAKVRITGWISSDQVRAELEASRALVLPSFAEGLPVAIMEAMALQRPVISTFVAGIPELVESGKNGWLVPAGNVDALVAAIETCLTCGSDQLGAMGRRGKEQVCANHDAEVEARKLLALIFEDYS